MRPQRPASPRQRKPTAEGFEHALAAVPFQVSTANLSFFTVSPRENPRTGRNPCSPHRIALGAGRLTVQNAKLTAYYRLVTAKANDLRVLESRHRPQHLHVAPSTGFEHHIRSPPPVKVVRGCPFTLLKRVS